MALQAPTLMPDGRLEIVGDLVVQDRGIDLHAKPHAGALDEDTAQRDQPQHDDVIVGGTTVEI